MKKIFTLFAAAMMGVCAFAQMPESCPSELNLKLLNGDQLNLVKVELQVTNSSLNLNGFNVELDKGESTAVFRKSGGDYFSAADYAPVILQRWETTMGEDEETGEEIEVPVTDDMRAAKLLNMCDVQSNVKTNGNLVMIELLKTNECRFFPVLDNFTAIGKFWMDWSAVANSKDAANECTISAPAEPARYSFSYTGGVEGTRAWTPEAPIVFNMEYVDGIVRERVPDAISTISTDKNVDNRIFDLQGRELQSVPEHGIYIQNGKKYVK